MEKEEEENGRLNWKNDWAKLVKNPKHPTEDEIEALIACNPEILEKAASHYHFEVPVYH